jgi:hypothetical protein
MRITEEAGGAWMWAERIALGASAIAGGCIFAGPACATALGAVARVTGATATRVTGAVAEAARIIFITPTRIASQIPAWSLKTYTAVYFALGGVQPIDTTKIGRALSIANQMSTTISRFLE